MTKAFIIIIIILLITNCNENKNISSDYVLNANEKFVFLETHDKSSSRGAGHFMDLVIMDGRYFKKYYITNDIFIDETPAISSDGKYIAFFSAREGNPLILQIEGLGAHRKFYLFNCETKSYKKISDKDFLNGYSSEIFFYKDTTEFIYSKNDTIKTFNVNTNEEKILKIIKGNFDLNKILFSQEKNIMVLYGSSKNIIVWNIKTKKEFKISLSDFADLGSINKEGDKFLYTTVKNHYLYEYDTKKRNSRKIDLPRSNIAFPVYWSNFYYTKDGYIVGIASDKYKTDDNSEREIVAYKIKTKKYRYLTKDGLQKYSLLYWNK